MSWINCCWFVFSTTWLPFSARLVLNSEAHDRKLSVYQHYMSKKKNTNKMILWSEIKIFKKNHHFIWRLSQHPLSAMWRHSVVTTSCSCRCSNGRMIHKCSWNWQTWPTAPSIVGLHSNLETKPHSELHWVGMLLFIVFSGYFNGSR